MNVPTRRFTVADQEWFARVSGDSNPLHVDAAWAAATFPGELVVHGLHALLWGLDRHLAAHKGVRVGGVHATFLKPIVVGDDVNAEAAADGSVFRLTVRGEPVVVVRLPQEAGATPVVAPGPAANRTVHGAHDRSAEQFVGLAGAIAVPDRALELADMFPAIIAAIGPSALSGLAALSTLVGMECPGLHSIFSEFSVSLLGSQAAGPLAFRVKRHDAAFSRVEMEVSGFGIAGSVAAFAGRPGPAPPSAGDIRALVSPAEFAGQQPLVVGASSGLGAVTALLLAAGGARPMLTWHRSCRAAEEIARTASTLAGKCELVQLDVGRPAEGLSALTEAGWQGGQLYYFASPRIFRRRLEIYQGEDLRDFLRIYVDGFYEVIRGVMKMRRGARLAVFYPSSVAVSEAAADLFEYKIAKLAGEQLCKRLEQKYKSLTIAVVRLPRIATRQTQTFVKVRADAPERVMSPIVKAMQGAHQGPTT